MQNNIFTITIGDHSRDGHNMFDQIFVQTDQPLENIKDAFYKACIKLNLIEDHSFVIASNYEDNSLSPEFANTLQKANIKFDDLIEEYEPGEAYFCQSECMAELLLRIAQSELDFDYTIIDFPDFNGFGKKKINLSLGYGLFS